MILGWKSLLVMWLRKVILLESPALFFLGRLQLRPIKVVIRKHWKPTISRNSKYQTSNRLKFPVGLLSKKNFFCNYCNETKIKVRAKKQRNFFENGRTFQKISPKRSTVVWQQWSSSAIVVSPESAWLQWPLAGSKSSSHPPGSNLLFVPIQGPPEPAYVA